MLLVQVVLTFASVQRLTLSDADCCRPWGWDFISHAGRRRRYRDRRWGGGRRHRRFELQQVVMTFGADHHRLPLTAVAEFLLGLFVRVML